MLKRPDTVMTLHPSRRTDDGPAHPARPMAIGTGPVVARHVDSVISTGETPLVFERGVRGGEDVPGDKIHSLTV